MATGDNTSGKIEKGWTAMAPAHTVHCLNGHTRSGGRTGAGGGPMVGNGGRSGLGGEEAGRHANRQPEGLRCTLEGVAAEGRSAGYRVRVALRGGGHLAATLDVCRPNQRWGR